MADLNAYSDPSADDLNAILIQAQRDGFGSNTSASNTATPATPVPSDKPSTAIIDKLNQLHQMIPSKPADAADVTLEQTPMGDMLKGILTLTTQGATDYVRDLAWAATGGKGMAPSDTRKLNEIQTRTAHNNDLIRKASQ